MSPAYVPPQLRKCEKEYLPAFDKQTFSVFSESFPSWLLSIELPFCEKVWMIGYPSAESFEAHLNRENIPLDLWHRITSFLGSQRLGYSMVGPDAALNLVSGTMAYLKTHCTEHPDSPAVLLFDNHHRRMRPSPRLDNVRWVNLSHVRFGGASSYRCTVGYHRMEGFQPQYSDLRRHVGDLIDYGQAKFASVRTADSMDSRLTLLDPLKLDQVFEYECHRSWTKHAFRSLLPDEIGALLGLPERFRKEGLAMKMFNFVPVQIMDGVLRPLVVASRRRAEVAQRVTPRKIEPRPPRTWLPSIREWLPHSWIDPEVITDKAAKGDNAGVCVELWNKRITLVLPSAACQLQWLRFSLVGGATRRMYLETRAFLADQHGPDWASRYALLRLEYYREISCLLGGDSASKSDGGSPNGEGQVERKLVLPALLDPFSFPNHVNHSRTPTESELADRELWHDVIGVAESIRAIGGSSWWSWNAGSRLFFWRWPPGEQRKAARDGMKAYFKSGPRPNFKRRARPPKSDDGPKIFEKIHKFLLRGYMSLPPIVTSLKSLVEFFSVPKGEDDVRVVFNGTGCGLNKTLFAPNFWLPSARTASDKLDFGYSSVDLDLGEMFPNFPLPMELRQYSGIDLTPFRDLIEENAPELLPKDYNSNSLIWGRWERNWMGAKPSPEMSIKFYYWAEEFVRGNRLDSKNALRWDCVRLNLPGSEDYDPSLPRVMKWVDETNRLANDIVTFVDDCRASGYDTEESWKVARQLASRLQYLGIQDAPRKRRPPAQTEAGAWAGAILASGPDRITKTVSKAKWEKGKKQLKELFCSWEVANASGEDWRVNYKSLEKIRGFFVHLSMTFPTMIPYLKGMHMTLCVHLAQRDHEGWKRSDKDWMAYVSHMQERGDLSDEEAHMALNPPSFEETPIPHYVSPVPRFIEDIKVLLLMMKNLDPPLMLVRSNKVLYVVYGFADASGSGFGSSFLLPDGTSVRIGTWGSDESENSSNWREFENAVEGLEEEARLGNLDGCVVYLATDNSTVEACSASGTSTSPKLHSLVIRLRALELATGCHLVVFHVSGERMKAQGTDGFSRGSLKEGVATGSPMLSFIPLHLSALDRHPPLQVWFNSWMTTSIKEWKGISPETLTPEGWFERGHDLEGGAYDAKGFWRVGVKKGRFLWVPPPGAAENALEELRKARLKRQDSLHVIAIPRLLGPEWRRLLHKTCDLVFELPPGHPCWPKGMFEPLIIGLCFPFIRSEPWQLKGTPKMFAMERKLRRLLGKEKMDGGSVLREFLLESERLSSMPRDVVRKMLHFGSGS